MMRKSVSTLAICGLLLIGLPPAVGAEEASAAAPAANGAISRMTGDELAAILKEEGYVAKVEKPSVVTMKIEGYKTLLLIADDNESMQAYAAFKSDKATLHRINEWNKTKRYSRAYIDKDGDPVIELDLDLVGGVQKERIADFIRTVVISVPAFAKEFLNAD
ncbi:YbjN domain-containing protein [uncultured Thiodictyon sp.]|uniref:YbjN domain-containing protein n=1 Tax=uncultured Thiodictyon sp. TaxID=1846217 RepID=UPI0025CDDBFB|nr:YbjN domain-containing protein [uncultured Thiodictyon sp.]